MEIMQIENNKIRDRGYKAYQRRKRGSIVKRFSLWVKGSLWRSVGLSIIVGIFIGYFISNNIVTVVRVVGSSMNPTYKSGDFLLINRLGNPDRGDVVTFEKDDMYLIKRVVGLPGDIIILSGQDLYVNGVAVDEPYTIDMGGYQYIEKQYIVGEGECFVLGDNRLNSKDSRVFGCVPIGEIIGEGMF